MHREVESPVRRVRVGAQESTEQDRGESGALPSDEVSMPELDVTLHGCKGGPVMGVLRDSLVYSPRESCEVNSEVRPRMPGESEGTEVSAFTGDSLALKPVHHALHAPPSDRCS